MNRLYQPLLISCLIISCMYSLHSQESTLPDQLSNPHSEFQLRTGINIGGFTPIPLPAEIREISGFNPKLNISIEGSFTRWSGHLPGSWGIRTGIRLENKGMKANSVVKNYGMEIIGEEGERVSGNWTGGVSTQVINAYGTIPIVLTHKLSNKWELSGGGFISFLADREFSGYVFDGYLREGGPTGNKVVFENNTTASYDFSDDLRVFSYGIQIGSAWQAYDHLNVFADLTFGLNDVFKPDFETISFAMRPIYLNIGFGYIF